MTKVAVKYIELDGTTFNFTEEQSPKVEQAVELLGRSMPSTEKWNNEIDKSEFSSRCGNQPDANKKSFYISLKFTAEEIKDFIANKLDFSSRLANKAAKGSAGATANLNPPQEEETVEEVKVETPIEKLEKQIAKKVEALGELKIVESDNKEDLSKAVNEITASFESQIATFQEFITVEFLEGQDLLKDLGKDLPAEDIDKIYFVHGDNPNINSKASERKKEVVKFLSTRSKTSHEYKLALNFRVAKYKTEVAKFIKSYINTHIRLVAQRNSEAVNQPVVEVRSKIDDSAQYKTEMEKVLKLKAKRASEKLEKTRKLEKARAMKAVAKAGIIAVLDNCVEEARRKLNEQFNNAVVVTRTQMEVLSQKIEGFDPKSNVEHYQQLVKNVLEILETNPDFKIEPIGSNTDSNSEVTEEEVFNQVSQNAQITPEMQQQFMRMFNMGGMPQASNGRVSAAAV